MLPQRRELLDGKRKAELARNLATAIAIRDDEGENLAADRTVRLKARQPEHHTKINSELDFKALSLLDPLSNNSE